MLILIEHVFGMPEGHMFNPWLLLLKGLKWKPDSSLMRAWGIAAILI